LNKALLDTDILSEIGKAKDATVAANAKTYRRSFGHYTLSTVSVMEVVSGFQKTQATGRLNAFGT
jgi:tRNA(fMet)-specific endonuclease VapC